MTIIIDFENRISAADAAAVKILKNEKLVLIYIKESTKRKEVNLDEILKITIDGTVVWEREEK